MATTTTLMTFLVRCPPNTTSVNLLGSWDNFSTAYPMQRDSRVGSEHWRGCHSFKNIICDGNLDSVGISRDGGLKMGGTYWYYYQLDDDIEFHDSSKPSTTACPLLPGQLLNVLHVPFHFSGRGHERNASISSTSSDLRTMDPETKFLNPRPAPPPRLPRLQTSPPLAQKADAFDQSPTSFSPLSSTSESSGRCYSQPSSATSPRRFRLPKARPLDSMGRSTSPTKPGGFLATLKQLAAKASDVEHIEARSPSGARHLNAGDQSDDRLSRTSAGRVNKYPPSSRASSRNRSPSSIIRLPSPSASLIPPFVSYGFDTLDDVEDRRYPHSLQVQQRTRSRSREPSPLGRSLVLEKDVRPQGDVVPLRLSALDTLPEVPSQRNSPIWPSTSFGKPDQNKRLPTLPNSPSSAFEDCVSATSVGKSLDEEILRSHFSALTISTRSDESPTTTEMNSPFVDGGLDLNRWPLSGSWVGHDIRRSPNLCEEATTLPGFINSPGLLSSMPQTPTTDNAESMPDLSCLPSEVSSSTISTQESGQPYSLPATIPGLGIGTSETFRNQERRQAGLFQYKLPVVEESPVESKYGASPKESDRPTYSPIAVRRHDSIDETNNPGFPHSNTMRQLLDELSYLGNMITT